MSAEPATIEALQAEIVRRDVVRIVGAATKSTAEAGSTISLRAMSGIAEYSPDECVITAAAGTPLAEIDGALSSHGHYLPFDPPLAAAGATIGGTIAAGLSGPLRYRYGGVRDFVIGARIVDGEGRVIRSGGKVVKNAAGFLLHHAMVGSQGAFGAIAEITLKVFPRPEARVTIKTECGSAAAAAAAVRALEARRLDLEAVDFDGDGALWIRVAGRAAAIDHRAAVIRDAVGGTLLDPSHEQALWARARDFTWADSACAIVKVPLSGPSQANIEAVTGAVTAAATPEARGPQQLWFSCGSRCAWIAARDAAALAAPLAKARLRGAIVKGPGAGTILGTVERNVFEERVRHVLDPHHRFRAASHSA